MLQVIKGSDKVAILNHLASLKEDDGSVINYTGYNKNKELILDSLTTISLLPQNNIYYITLDSSDSDLDIELLNTSKKKYILDVSDLKGNSKVVKQLKKFTKIDKFDSKRDFRTFNIAEEILINKNINKALQLCGEIENQVGYEFSVLYALHHNYKLLLAMHIDHSLYTKQRLFVQNKLSKTNYTKQQLSTILYEIYSIDKDLKTNNVLDFKIRIKNMYISINTGIRNK